MSVCTNQSEISMILNTPLEGIFDSMKKTVEESDEIEREWQFHYFDVTFTVKCKLKGDGVAE